MDKSLTFVGSFRWQDLYIKGTKEDAERYTKTMQDTIDELDDYRKREREKLDSVYTNIFGK